MKAASTSPLPAPNARQASRMSLDQTMELQHVRDTLAIEAQAQVTQR